MHHTTQRPDVTLRSLRVTLASFWRHIVRGAYDCHSHLSSAFQNFGYSKITNFDSVVGCQENILRLKISMYNPTAM